MGAVSFRVTGSLVGAGSGPGPPQLRWAAAVLAAGAVDATGSRQRAERGVDVMAAAVTAEQVADVGASEPCGFVAQRTPDLVGDWVAE